jgi:hypothetical protein
VNSLDPGYYFVPERIVADFLRETDHEETYLADFLRSLSEQTLPRNSTLLVRGLDAALKRIPPMELSAFLYSKLAGKASQLQGRRVAVVFCVEKARKNQYYYIIQSGKKLKLDDVFGSLLSDNNGVIFAHPI